MKMRHLGGYDRLPFPILEAGRWWGSDPKTHRQEEIDSIVTGADPTKAVFCERKWRNDPVGESEYRSLQRCSRLLPYPNKHYALFSESGFTDHLQRLVDGDSTVQLVSFDEMTVSRQVSRKVRG